MKLHQLSIQAFGPFAGKETINFDDLGDNPLFLIDGPTGAGKSSILHAICYALYGETTDDARKDIGVRCDNANADLLTELNLEFSIRKQHYRITRTPTQMRQAKRGEGVTEQKAAAHLRKILDDGKEQTLVAKKKKDADEQIKKIVGLSADQFRQVMVLPQGKFRELLLAKSDERQAILSTLFQTQIYKRIEQVLKDKSLAIERDYKRFKDQIDETLNEVFVTNSDELKTTYESALSVQEQSHQHKLAAEEAKQVALVDLKNAQGLAQLFTDQAQKQQQLQQHLTKDSHIESMQVLVRKAEQANLIAGVYQTWQQTHNDLMQKRQLIDSANENLVNAEQRLALNMQHLKIVQQQYSQRDSLLGEQNQLQHFSTIQKDYHATLQSAEIAGQNEQQAQQRITDMQGKLAEYEQRSLKGQQLIDGLIIQVNNKAELQLQQHSLQQKQQLLQQIEHINSLISDERDVQQNLNKKFQQCQQQLKQSTANANKIEMLWHSNQAAILAKTLQQDAPCPVCGSLQHPTPANIGSSQENITKDMVEQARGVQHQAILAANQADKLCNQSKQSMVHYQQQLSQKLVELGNDKGLSNLELVNQVQSQLQQVTDALNAIVVTEQKIKPAQDKLQAMKNETINIQQRLEKLQQHLPLLSKQANTAQANVLNIEQTLPKQYRHQTAVQSALKQIKETLETLERSFTEAQNKQQQSSQQVGAVKAQLEELASAEQLLLTREKTQHRKWLQALEGSHFDDLNDFITANIAEPRRQEIVEEINEFLQHKQVIASQLDLLTQQLNNQKKPNVEQLEAQTRQQDAQYNHAEQLWVDAKTTVSRLNEAMTKINRIETEQAENKKQFEVIATLANAAGGRGKVRVSLERFVLADLLDSVLAIASKRLHIMSKGQYQLVRQDETAQKKNVTAGLDLAIDDAHTGKTRPVSTLSGGESFMASLALALGLSDVVQQRSGGIELDTLFIDEGFGSLDQDSLQLAISTLMDLQQNGRSIGIISHVSELKEQMALRIDVQRARHGSNISTVS